MTLTSQEYLALEHKRRFEACGICGGMLRLDSREGRVFCWQDPTHEGTVKPTRTAKPYGLLGQRADEAVHV